MKQKSPFLFGFLLIILVLSSLAGCNMPGTTGDAAATMDVTQAYQTVEARLTQAATQSPPVSSSPTPASTITLLPTPSAIPTSTTPTPPPATKTALPTTACDLASPGNPIDVTIPDDSIMAPGQTFTKIWRLQNSGTCTWSKDYSIAVFSGEGMNAAASIPMPGVIAPGQTVDIGVDLIAPLQSGTYQGNWKLRNASKAWFGIGPGGGAAFWVRIIVQAQSTGTAASSTAAATTVPEVQASGTKTLIPGDGLNLDNNQINNGAGDDIAYSTGDNQQLLLTPSNGSLLGVFGSGQPGFNDCQSSSMGSSPIILKQPFTRFVFVLQNQSGPQRLAAAKGFQRQRPGADASIPHLDYSLTIVGTLYLVATPIGNLEDISFRAVRILREARLIAAEDTRQTHKLLQHYQIHTPAISYHEHNKLSRLDQVLAALSEGDVALVSDAGTPALNDPGFELVRAALDAGFQVSPIPGASAPLAALVSSGLPTDAFLYLGYLPRRSVERRKALQLVETLPYTLIFLETPHRLLESLRDLLHILGDRPACLARELTKLYEEILRAPLSQALAHFESHEPRGEFTLVIGGKPAQIERFSADQVNQAIQLGLLQGQTPARLAGQIATQSGWPRREIYRMITEMEPKER